MTEKDILFDNTQPPPKDVSKRDKRYLPRWQVNNRVVCILQEEHRSYEGVSRDLNCMGICITTCADFTMNQKIKLRIYLSDDIAVKVEGHVVWAHTSPDDRLLGITFENISREAQDLLLQYAYEIKKNDIIKHWFTGWSDKEK